MFSAVCVCLSVHGGCVTIALLLFSLDLIYTNALLTLVHLLFPLLAMVALLDVQSSAQAFIPMYWGEGGLPYYVTYPMTWIL